MATTTKLLQLRPKLKRFPQPKPNFFSSSSSSSSNSNPENTPLPSEPHQTPPPKPFSFSSISNTPQNPSSNSSSFDEIRKNLAEFRRRAATAGGGGGGSPPPSFQELYKKNVSTVRPNPTTGKVDFDAIRASLHKFKENNSNNNNSNNENRGKFFDSLSLSRYKDSLKLRPNMDQGGGSGMVIGGSSGSLPASIFGKEMMMRRDKEGGGGGDKEGMGMKFVRTYRHGELGEKLKKLRPVKKEEKGEFSLQELKDRLVKVRETDEENKSKSMIGHGVYMELEEALHKLTQPDGEKAKKTMIQRLDVLGQLGGTPSFMLHPPKEQLVEKFFHPDHMSSGEKMKLELQKVRDEFKMSESDCGSARVQVAQLTTKIKHLSGVLHKKDKHSRKGLQEMVQKRKKLLKYLRRTDWDSYCLVLSKLGLRDNPDYKF